MPRTLTLQQDSLRKLSSQIVAILCLSITLVISESSHLIGANSSGNVKNNDEQQQSQSTYLQRPDPSGRPQLMVAIYCGGESSSALYHNQYIDIESRKWRTDRDLTAFCTQDKQAVLNYCKKVYPNYDVRNIVESNRPCKIDNWCKLGSNSKRRCRTKLTVRPYRCLEGTFQSDALLVPERCVFDHVHNKSVCESSDTWNKTAAESCYSKNMKLQSFGMLQPCGLDVFSGVEFVCCPNPNEPQSAKPSNHADNLEGNSFARAANAMVNWPKTTADDKLNGIKVDEDSSNKRQHHDQNNDEPNSTNDDGDDDDDDDDERYDGEEDEYDDDSTSWNNEKSSTTSTTTTTTTTTTTQRPIDHYLSHFDLSHEHDDFKKAEMAVESSYRDKITHVMREWSQLDVRYEELKKKDPQAAEEFKKKMTHQFQKTIEALEEEGAAQRHQLASMHAERAMAIINRRKKAAMDCLTQALDRMPIRTRQVERCIVKLLKALEKDRAHTLRQYKNLLNLNTREALHEKKIILDHLITLNRAANQSIAMLDRSPILVEKLKTRIIALWHRLRNIPLDEPIVRESELKMMEKYEEEVAQFKIERERKRLAELETKQNPASSTSTKAPNEHREEPKSTIDSSTVSASQASWKQADPTASIGNNNKVESNEISSRSSQPNLVVSLAQPDNRANLVSSTTFSHDLDVSDNGHEQTHYQIDSAKFSHLKAESPYHELSYSVKHDPMSGRFKFGYATLLASSCIAIVILAFVGVKYYGKNSTRAYKRQGFAEVGRACPEEKSVTNMQFNGYENPAYKYFETAEA